MFYEQLKKACKTRKTSVTAALKQIGIGTANGTYWKNGSVPSSDVVVKLAELLNVSTDYLLLGKEMIPDEQAGAGVIHTGDVTNSKIVEGHDNSSPSFNDISDDALELDKIIKSLTPKSRAAFLYKVYSLAEEFKD